MPVPSLILLVQAAAYARVVKGSAIGEFAARYYRASGAAQRSFGSAGAPGIID